GRLCVGTGRTSARSPLRHAGAGDFDGGARLLDVPSLFEQRQEPLAALRRELVRHSGLLWLSMRAFSQGFGVAGFPCPEHPTAEKTSGAAHDAPPLVAAARLQRACVARRLWSASEPPSANGTMWSICSAIG